MTIESDGKYVSSIYRVPRMMNEPQAKELQVELDKLPEGRGKV